MGKTYTKKSQRGSQRLLTFGNHLCLLILNFISPIFSSLWPRPPSRRGVQGSRNSTSSQGMPGGGNRGGHDVSAVKHSL